MNTLDHHTVDGSTHQSPSGAISGQPYVGSSGLGSVHSEGMQIATYGICSII